MFEILFLSAFTLHNIEEALWLPNWSKHAKRFHAPVEINEFHFAVLIVTVIGYFLTFLFLIYGNSSEIIRYSYFGFVLMMSINAIFSHFIALFVLKKYSPGVITGVVLNLPIGIYIVFVRYSESLTNYKLFFGFAVITFVTLVGLKPLFKAGRKLID